MAATRGRPGGESTRLQIVLAALETLKTEGFSGATSRAIARAGGFNQALIFYHFGTLDSLLLAALDHTDDERFVRYRAAVDEAESVEELVEVVTRLYAEDRDSGHMTVVSQMIAGSVARPELAPPMLERMNRWIDLCEEGVEKLYGRVTVPRLVPARELAYAVVTFYLGVNLLTHLDRGGSRTAALFARLESVSPLLADLP